MALVDMSSEITDLVPALGRVRSRKLINRAWKIVQDSCLWSFQLQQGSFSTPPITTGGTVSCTLGSNQVTGDAVASAAWLALAVLLACDDAAVPRPGLQRLLRHCAGLDESRRRGAHARPELH